MTSRAAVYEPVRLARLAWQRTQPQLFIELPDARTTAPAIPLAGRRPAAATNTTGPGSASPEETHAAGARREPS